MTNRQLALAALCALIITVAWAQPAVTAQPAYGCTGAEIFRFDLPLGVMVTGFGWERNWNDTLPPDAFAGVVWNDFAILFHILDMPPYNESEMYYGHFNVIANRTRFTGGAGAPQIDLVGTTIENGTINVINYPWPNSTLTYSAWNVSFDIAVNQTLVGSAVSARSFAPMADALITIPIGVAGTKTTTWWPFTWDWKWAALAGAGVVILALLACCCYYRKGAKTASAAPAAAKT